MAAASPAIRDIILPPPPGRSSVLCWVANGAGNPACSATHHLVEAVHRRAGIFLMDANISRLTTEDRSGRPRMGARGSTWFRRHDVTDESAAPSRANTRRQQKLDRASRFFRKLAPVAPRPRLGSSQAGSSRCWPSGCRDAHPRSICLDNRPWAARYRRHFGNGLRIPASGPPSSSATEYRLAKPTGPIT